MPAKYHRLGEQAKSGDTAAMGLLFVGAGFWVCCIIAAELIAHAKGRSGCGFSLLTFFIGPIGLIAAALASPNERVLIERDIRSGRLIRCLWCAEPVQPSAIICKACGRDLPRPVPRSGLAGFIDRILGT